MNSDVPRTEESLQAALAALARARKAGDEAAAGAALLQLAYLVKWVRSDNEQPPFERSYTLATEALEIFQRLGDARGECGALLAAAPLEALLAAPCELLAGSEPLELRAKAEKMLLRAEWLARECGDTLLRARAAAARGRQMARYDRDQARVLTAQALALFRELGNARGSAGCLLSAAIQSADFAEKRTHALEASRLYRRAGASRDCGMALIMAMVGIEELADKGALEEEILLVLRDAEGEGNRGLQGQCFAYLAQIATTRGEGEAAARFKRRRDEMKLMEEN